MEFPQFRGAAPRVLSAAAFTGRRRLLRDVRAGPHARRGAAVESAEPHQSRGPRRYDLTEHRGGLHVRLSSMLSYRVPARAAGLVRAVLLGPSFLPPSGASGAPNAATVASPSWLFARPDGAPLDDRALVRLRHTGATHAGVAACCVGPERDVTDLHRLPRSGS
ncbi:hypothetical protein [Pseudonocardia sp. H11422]|uniref:hypothetical protein n=1 Tax=Pseudonocardia sp. H11422 TaxID=2835866 RepID=UPI00292D0E71|nr:hypothetical protein [Pseudonocardia sp. H11422]